MYSVEPMQTLSRRIHETAKSDNIRKEYIHTVATDYKTFDKVHD